MKNLTDFRKTGGIESGMDPLLIVMRQPRFIFPMVIPKASSSLNI